MYESVQGLSDKCQSLSCVPYVLSYPARMEIPAGWLSVMKFQVPWNLEVVNFVDVVPPENIQGPIFNVRQAPKGGHQLRFILQRDVQRY